MLFRPTAYPGIRVRSLPRDYESGVSLVTEGRPDLLYIRIQNRGAGNMWFWHGRVPSGELGDGPDLPLDPAEWTAQETSDAENLIQDFGEEIGNNDIFEPRIAQTGPLYNFNTGSSTKAHVVVGFASDQEQGVGGHGELGT